MSVIVTDGRTIWDQADAETWDGAAPTAYTEAPDPIESTASLGIVVSTSTEDSYFTTTSINVSTGTQIFVWVLPQGIMDTKVLGGSQLLLGDGTNRVGFHLAGSDKAVFRYNNAGVNWQCLMIDTSQLFLFDNVDEHYTERAGTLASLSLEAITQIGAVYKTLVKAVGGVENCFTDIIRYGNQGLTITGGLTGARGTFLEVALEDSSTADQKAFGIIRELATNTYGCQSVLTFGQTGVGDSWFSDSGITLIFEDAFVSDSIYKINVLGNPTVGEETHFILDGSSIISAGPGVTLDFSSTGIDTLTLTNNLFKSLKNGILFGNDSYAASHIVTNNIFDVCGQIDPGDVEFKFNTISNTTNADGSLLIDADGTTNMDGLVFISDGTGHAIYITAPGTYNFNNFTYSGYGITDSTDAVIYNNSGGAVTINVLGGDVPSYRNGTSATTSVVASFTLTLTDLIEGAQVTIVKSSDRTELQNSIVGVSGEVIYAHGGTDTVDILLMDLDYDPNLSDIYDLVLPSSDSTIKFSMLDDLNFYNPA